MKVGQRVKIPSDNLHPEKVHSGTVVFISEDRKTVAVACKRSHGGKQTVFIVQFDSKK